jgi:cation:H+ antiporter
MMASLPIWGNVLVFVAAGAVIWIAGVRLEHRVDQIARRTGMGQAFSGMLLLAIATSLPELATTFSAVLIHDNATLAVHNLLGGVALQTAILVLADATSRKRGALTSFRPRFTLLVQAVGVIMLLQIAIAAATAKGVPALGPVSLWSLLLVVGFIAMTYFVHHHRGHPRWTPAKADDFPKHELDDDDSNDEPADAEDDELSTRSLWLRFAAAAAFVLVGGWLTTGAADALAEQTGLGSAFVGATLLALATSLPEVSTTTAAVRAGRYTAAVSNIFGSNAFDIALLFVADAIFLEGTIMAHAESSMVFIAAVAAVMTCVYLWGLMERADRTILRIGWDSALALVIYLTGVAVLYLAW